MGDCCRMAWADVDLGEATLTYTQSKTGEKVTMPISPDLLAHLNRPPRCAKFVEWSDEDQCFIGRCPELMGGGVHGSNEARVNAELCQAVEEMLELIHTDGHVLPEPLAAKKFSGKFVLRVEPALHRHLAAKAFGAGESLNSYCTKTLAKV